MNKFRIFYLLCLIFNFCTAKYESSWPYISGDTFRAFCKFKIDETSLEIDVSNVKTGDTIFVHPPYLELFFSKIHPHIQYPYILVTNNDDMTVPGQFVHYLNDDKLAFWFGENANFKHHKIIPIPLGIMNETLIPWCKTAIGNLDGHRITLEKVLKSKKNKKDILLYVNFEHHDMPTRKKVYDFFKTKDFCFCPERKPLDGYLEDIARSKFVLSPTGVGLDCVRTWESLYLNSFPIIKSCPPFDYLYDDLPVLIVKDFETITQDFLEKKYNDLCKKKYNLDKLYAPYWLKLIRSYQAKVRLRK